ARQRTRTRKRPENDPVRVEERPGRGADEVIGVAHVGAVDPQVEPRDVRRPRGVRRGNEQPARRPVPDRREDDDPAGVRAVLRRQRSDAEDVHVGRGERLSGEGERGNRDQAKTREPHATILGRARGSSAGQPPNGRSLDLRLRAWIGLGDLRRRRGLGLARRRGRVRGGRAGPGGGGGRRGGGGPGGGGGGGGRG